MRRFFFLFPACLVVILDQMTKIWCVHHLILNHSEPFIDHILYLTLTYNSRGAFSLFPFPNLFFIAMTLILIGFFLFYALRYNLSYTLQLFIGLLIGGGIGNLIDRIRLGYVIDFLDLRFWPVFNFADSAVTVSMIFFFFYFVNRKG
ncbi:MAG: signal peptidase II [Candidatus Eremiobacteraeota bacterium]|nr:signal peptidase II [Candidatus Eremiobacteraeota bacterium]MCL5055564.1 signal peptidase II [Bacillota bacterium]